MEWLASCFVWRCHKTDHGRMLGIRFHVILFLLVMRMYHFDSTIKLWLFHEYYCSYIVKIILNPVATYRA